MKTFWLWWGLAILNLVGYISSGSPELMAVTWSCLILGKLEVIYDEVTRDNR